MKSGTSHHRVPSAVKTGHHTISARRRGPGVRVRIHTIPSGRTANVAAALTPPTMATASAENAAARLGDPDIEPRNSGSRTHGASALGQDSTEIGPSVLSMRGDSA